MNEVNFAKERALSRADIMNSLDKSYGLGVETLKNKKLNSNPNINKLSNTIQILIGNDDQKKQDLFHETLREKSIVLENVKAQIKASKSSVIQKCKIKSQKRASNSWLKKHVNWDPLKPCELNDAFIMNDLWNRYIVLVLNSCKSDAQLQARIHSCELVGAVVSLTDYSVNSNYIGLQGIITAVTVNNYFILFQIPIKIKKEQDLINSMEKDIKNEVKDLSIIASSTANNTNGNIHSQSKESKVKVVRFLKDLATLAVFLPSSRCPVLADQQAPSLPMSHSQSHQLPFQSVCILYGKKSSPYSRNGPNSTFLATK